MSTSLKNCNVVLVTAVVMTMMLFYEVYYKDFEISRNTMIQLHPLSLRKTLSNKICDTFSKTQEIYSLHNESNEHEQLYSFFRRINEIYDRNHTNVSHTLDNITLKFVENYENHTQEVQSLFEEWDKKANTSWKEFEWNVRFFNNTEDGHIFIHILETKKHMPTSGGSSFTFLQTSANTKDFCPITDHFNGTYTVRCIPHEDNTVIKGDVHFINLTTFTKKTIISYKTIFQQTQIRLKSSFCGEEFSCKSPDRAYWVLRNNSWHWFTGSHVIPTTQRDTLRQCLQQFTQVTMIGDSHMRYWFFYILIKLGLLPRDVPGKLMGRMDVENISFRWGDFMSTLNDKLRAELKRMDDITKSIPKHERKRKPLIVINSIDWDILNRSISGYFAAFYKLVEILKGVVEKKSVRVVYLSGVAFNNENKPRRWPFLGYIFRAVNHIVLKKLGSIGIETIDVNTMLYSVNEYPAYTDHYLKIIPKTQNVQGRFGPGAADRILEQLCREV